VDEKRTVLSLERCFFFQFRYFPSTAPHCYTYSRAAPRHRSARDRNSFPSISIFSPASGALMKNDSDARHYSSALSSVIGSFFPRARTHEKSNLSTTDIVFRPPQARRTSVSAAAASSCGKTRTLFAHTALSALAAHTIRHPEPPRQPLRAPRTPFRRQKFDRRHRGRDINWVAATDMERERKVTRVHRKRDKLGVLFQSGDEQCTHISHGLILF